MNFWGMDMDIVIAMLVVMAIGISVDYAAHIAHAFHISTGAKVQKY